METISSIREIRVIRGEIELPKLGLIKYGEALKLGQFPGTFVEAEKVVAPEQPRRHDMENVVGAEAVFGRVACNGRFKQGAEVSWICLHRKKKFLFS
jgi:hypothetical protein